MVESNGRSPEQGVRASNDMKSRIQHPECQIHQGMKTTKSMVTPVASAGFKTMNWREWILAAKEHRKRKVSEIPSPEGGKRREEGGPEVGKSGSELRFFPALPTISRHFPPFPTSIFFAGQTQQNFGQRNDWQRNVVKESRNGAKNYGLLRIISRKSAKFHESSHRSGPWFGFPSPPRDGCPEGLFADAKRGRDCSDCYG